MPRGFFTFIKIIVSQYLIFTFNLKFLKLNIVFLLISHFLQAQTSDFYHIDIFNGLPSNHVYQAISDRYGYLWFATSKGVVRYNGYDFKTFDLSNGMSNDDVWHLFEDKSGKIWLSTISENVGYIYKGKYIKCVSNSSQTIRPKDVQQINNTIIFSDYQLNMYIVNNDTESSYLLTSINQDSPFIIDNKGEIVMIYYNTICKIYLNKLNIIRKTLFRYGTLDFFKKIAYQRLLYFGHYIALNYTFISEKNKENNVGILDLEKHIFYYLDSNIFKKNDNIHYTYVYKDHLYIIGKNTFYKVDTNLNLVQAFNISSISNDSSLNSSNVSYLFDNKFWGNCLTTFEKGVYINYLKKNFFLKNKFDLAGYKCVGEASDSITYWWNDKNENLIKITNCNISSEKRIPFLSKIKRVVPYNKERSLLIADENLFYFNNNSNEITSFFRDINLYIDSNFDYPNPSEKFYKTNYISGTDAIVKTPNDIYILFTGQGICDFILNGSRLFVNHLDRERYKELIYDSINHLIWLYDNEKILLVTEDHRKIAIPKDVIDNYGIRKIESIFLDKNGNVFIKDYDKLLMFNYFKFSVQRIFGNYNLKNASIELYKNKVIVVGKFGILFSKIEGPAKVSYPIVYPNIKNANYNFSYDFQCTANKILLVTDLGTYKVNIPSDNDFNNHQIGLKDYKLVIYYNDTLRNVKSGDSISISQQNAKIQFDVINPTGNGKVKYIYSLNLDDLSWHDLNSNEIDLSAFSPGKSYTLYVKASDDTWESDKIKIHLLIIPYWWQTNFGKRLILITGIIVIIILIIIVSLITRNIITKNNAKRNSRREIELKSIYSQINPHFVFNSLNTTLFFIKKKKMDEAYIHISKFSRLLRAYIKSSRNKYVAIAEEITNLRNYIELQQARFENKFNFEIVADENVAWDRIEIPALLLQPIVENAINHGLFHKEDKGYLKIEFRVDFSKNEVTCIVDDNGIGRKKSKMITSTDLVKAESYGDHLIKDLVDIFNKYEKINIDIEYIDKREPMTGTTVIVKIKNPLYDK